MRIKVSNLRKIIREVLEEDGPKTVRGVAPQNRTKLDPGDAPPMTVRGVGGQGPDSGSIDVLFDDADAEGSGPMTMRGLGLGGDEVYTDAGDDLEAVDAAPLTQRSPATQRGMGAKRPDVKTIDDLYSDWE
jgi:hypothetical protein